MILILTFLFLQNLWAQEPVVTICNQDQIKSYDLHATYDFASDQLLGSIYEPLFYYSSTGPKPLIADSYVKKENGRIWQIKLKPNISFHSNAFFQPTRKLNADDVVYSIQRQVLTFNLSHYDDERFQTYQLTMAPFLKSVKAIDPLTVEFELYLPKVDFLEMLSSATSAVYPKEYYELLKKNNDLEKIVTHPIGTGPFMIDLSLIGETGVWMKSFKEYHSKPHPFKLHFLSERNSVYFKKMIDENKCDWINSPPPELFKSLLASTFFHIHKESSHMMAMLYLNSTSESLASKEMRQYVISAIDREKILQKVFFGYARKADQPYHEKDIFHLRDAPPYIPYSAIKNQKVLKNLSLYVPIEPRPYLPDPLAAAQEIQEQLERLGVSVEIKRIPIQKLINMNASDNYDLLLLGDTDLNSKHTFKRLLCSGLMEPQTSTGYCETGLNKLLKEKSYVSLPSEEEKREVLLAIRASSALLPLWYAPKLTLTSKRIAKLVESSAIFQSWLYKH